MDMQTNSDLTSSNRLVTENMLSDSAADTLLMRDTLLTLDEMNDAGQELWNNVVEPGKRKLGGNADYTEYTALPVDMIESPSNFTLTAEIPGSCKIETYTKDGFFHIYAVKKDLHDEAPTSNHIHLHLERTFGELMKRYALPVGVNPENILTEYKLGVLTVTFPKLKEEKKVKFDKVDIEEREDNFLTSAKKIVFSFLAGENETPNAPSPAL